MGYSLLHRDLCRLIDAGIDYNLLNEMCGRGLVSETSLFMNRMLRSPNIIIDKLEKYISFFCMMHNLF